MTELEYLAALEADYNDDDKAYYGAVGSIDSASDGHIMLTGYRGTWTASWSANGIDVGTGPTIMVALVAARERLASLPPVVERAAARTERIRRVLNLGGKDND